MILLLDNKHITIYSPSIVTIVLYSIVVQNMINNFVVP